MARDGEDNKSVIIEARDDAQLVSNRFQSQSSPMMVKLILSIRSGNSWLQTRKSKICPKYNDSKTHKRYRYYIEPTPSLRISRHRSLPCTSLEV